MPNEVRTAFVAPFFEAAAEVLKQIGGIERTVEFPAAATDAPGKLSRIEVVLRTDARVRFAVEFGEEESQSFAKMLVGEPVADETERQAAVEELWRQIAGRATTVLSNVLSKGDLDVASSGGETWKEAASFPVRLVAGDSAAMNLKIHVSQEAMEYLFPPAPANVPDRVMPEADEHQNLDLLLDVPLSVTLRFGERRMPLREILQLASGAVIELDRHAEEPVELFLDEKVIARGNVVVVDGCYGLRVTEVCSRQSARMHPELRA
jgi:flagellar motor switch protein FliN